MTSPLNNTMTTILEMERVANEDFDRFWDCIGQHNQNFSREILDLDADEAVIVFGNEIWLFAENIDGRIEATQLGTTADLVINVSMEQAGLDSFEALSDFTGYLESQFPHFRVYDCMENHTICADWVSELYRFNDVWRDAKEFADMHSDRY